MTRYVIITFFFFSKVIPTSNKPCPLTRWVQLSTFVDAVKGIVLNGAFSEIFKINQTSVTLEFAILNYHPILFTT